MMINIFVSRPNSLSEEQENTIKEIEKLFKERDLVMRTIGTTDFPNVAPMLAVQNLMKECCGTLILGFPQTIIENGISKQNTPNEKNIENIIIPTPWNHIESAIAFNLNIPMLIIKDKEINGGIFDIGTTGHFIHTFDLSTQEWIKEPRFLQPFNEWYKDIISKK